MEAKDYNKLVEDLEKLTPKQLAHKMMVASDVSVPIEVRALMIEAAFRLSRLTGTR